MLRLSRARFDTRTLAYVAIFMPMKPALADIAAPMSSAAAACQVVMIAIRTAMHATTMARMRYS